MGAANSQACHTFAKQHHLGHTHCLFLECMQAQRNAIHIGRVTISSRAAGMHQVQIDALRKVGADLANTVRNVWKAQHGLEYSLRSSYKPWTPFLHIFRRLAEGRSNKTPVTTRLSITISRSFRTPTIHKSSSACSKQEVVEAVSSMLHSVESFKLHASTAVMACGVPLCQSAEVPQP